MSTIVHIVGTGTIGEPLIGLFADFGARMGVDEVTFHKRTPLVSDRAKLNHLMARGAKLAVGDDVRKDFQALGHEVSFERRRGARARQRGHRLHAGGQRQQGAVVQRRQRPARLPGAGQRVRLRQALRARHQRRGVRRRHRPLHPDRLLQHPQHRDADQDAGRRRRRQVRPRQRHLRLHPARQRHQPDRQVRAVAQRRPSRRLRVRHASRPRRPSRLQDPGRRSRSLLERGQGQHPVHALDLVPHRAQARDHAQGSGGEAARQPAGGDDRQEGRQRHLQLRPRPRLLRAHPVADGGGGADHHGAARARDLRLLLHAAGRQLAAVVDRGGAVARSIRTGTAWRSGWRRCGAGSTARSERLRTNLQDALG